MNRGYTLIELMIVVVIVAILVAIAIPAYNKHKLQEACRQSPDGVLCAKEKAAIVEQQSFDFVCRAGFQFDRNSQRQIIGVNGGGIPCK